MRSRVTAMQVYSVLVALATFAVTLASAIPKPADDHKNRVIDRGTIPDDQSEQPKHIPIDKHHEREKKLSDEPHFKDEDEHNREYDHEAFLGKEEARHFEDFTPEESKERLALIYDKIDKDSNGYVTEQELRDWIKYVQNKYILEDTNRQWKEHDVDAEGLLSWEAYNKRTYSFIDEDEEEESSYKQMQNRDQKRWQQADQDRDGKLSMEEFSDFLHPEDAAHMRDIVIDETLEDIDKNRDGQISLSEYIADMWPNGESEEEPDWVKTEREQFGTFRDKNKDGVMDRDEVADWILPSDYDHSEAEARHLIHESDSDMDKQLTKEEVVNKYDLFVGSQATDFGDALSRHDEF